MVTEVALAPNTRSRVPRADDAFFMVNYDDHQKENSGALVSGS
jgi:hypothetical protein